MTFQFNAYSVTLLALGAITLVISSLVFRRLGVARWFGYMMLCIAAWAITYGFELSTLTREDMLFWINLEYLGINFLPATWIVFVIRFIGRERWLSRRNLFLIFFMPVATTPLVWTNHLHHLYYKNVSVDTGGPFPLLDLDIGPWYIINTAYFYSMLIWGVYLLIVKFRKADAVYKKQNSTIILGALVPWIVNILYLLELRPFRHIDLTPFAFIITALLISFGLLRFKLFDIVPIAREKVIEAMKDGVIVLDSRGRIIDLNPEMRLYISSYENIIGSDLKLLFPHDAELYRMVTERVQGMTEIRLIRSEVVKHFEVTVTPLFDEGTIYSGVLLIFREVTVQKTIAAQLKSRSEELTASNNLKDKLFSVIAHDLRSPLINLTDVLKMLDEKMISRQEFDEMLPALSKNAGYAFGLLENLLNWSKSQLKGETVNPVYFDLAAVLKGVLSLFEQRLGHKDIRILNGIQPNTFVFADRNMTDLVLRNLVSNAIKFSHHGGTIRLESVKDGRTVKICVHDEGIGITEANLRRILVNETFTTNGTDDEQGTGLGLLLCRDFIEKNNGKMEIASRVGEGSSFCFTVPAEPA